MSNIMSQLKLKNKVSRNAFDLGRRNAFTAKVGELLPVMCIEILPGDNIKGKIQHFTRTMPVNTAAYTRIREYYDFFFVPTNLLWNKFNTFVTQMVNNNQHASSISGSQTLSDTHPYFTCNQLASYVAAITKSDDRYNILNYNRGLLTCKLLHYLGYGDYYKSATDGVAQPFRTNANLNPFPLLAYQKIYQDYFRHDQWENGYSPAFNVDYISGSGTALDIPVSELTTQSRYIMNMFDLRYCNWNKDKFMGLQRTAQYGDGASIVVPVSSSLGTDIFNLQATNSVSQYISIGITPHKDIVSSSDGTHINFKLNDGNAKTLQKILGVNNISILALRQAEALQKWKEITMSQNQDYKSQVEAHFGVDVPDAYSDRCRYIDGVVSNLDISEVTNTNLADGNAPEIAGKGVGVGDGNFNYKSDVHGYLMCIYHAVPLLDYASEGINRMNLKTKVTDYAIPEFDRTGMVAVPTIELTNSSNNPTFTASLLGYAPRYYEYKTAIDEVHGGFYNGTTDITNWVAPIDAGYINKFVAAMHGDGRSITYQWFKVNPAVLNPIFVTSVTNDYTNNPLGIADDQLLINASFDITAVRNLDRNGLPY